MSHLRNFSYSGRIVFAAVMMTMWPSRNSTTSPEQLLLRHLSPASDVFGLAGVFFHLFTGEDYFEINDANDGVSILRARGCERDGRRILRTARTRLLESAEKIGELGWRKSFLTHVGDNRELLQLADDWLGKAGIFLLSNSP